MELWLRSGGTPVRSSTPAKSIYALGARGYGIIRHAKTWTKIEATGLALVHLRAAELFLEYLSVLAECPHKVTRLDAALDTDRDFVDVRRELHAAFPDYTVNAGRKGVDVTEFIAPRLDGELTGTWYAGKRGRNRQVLRVYDKSWEQLSRHAVTMPPTTRYEVEVGRQVGATLRDAVEPERIFYHFMPGDILPRPADLPPWEPSDFTGWSYQRSELTAYATLARFVEHSPDLATMRTLAESLGPHGMDTLAKLIADALTSDKTPSPLSHADKSEATPPPELSDCGV